MVEYKAIITSTLKEIVEIQETKAPNIGEAYNKIQKNTTKYDIITILTQKQWKNLVKQIQN